MSGAICCFIGFVFAIFFTGLFLVGLVLEDGDFDL